VSAVAVDFPDEHGHLVAVTAVTAGDELVASAAISDLTLFVGDVADFAEEGGWLTIGGNVIAYTTCDDDLSTITLTTAMVATAAVEDRVDVWDADSNQPVVEYVASVMLDGQDEGDPIEAAIDHSLVDLLSPTINSEGGWSVDLEWTTDDDLTVVRVNGKQPFQTAAFLDPGTIPDPIPITPPVVSPAVTLTGIPGGIIGRAEAVSPSTLIEYHISTTSGFTPTQGDSVTLIPPATRATVIVIDHMPDGSSLIEDTFYYIRTIATNAAGSAAPSAEVAGKMDMNAVRSLVVAELFAGFILGNRIQMGAGYLDANEGLVLPQPDGTTTRLTLDGVTPSTISGFLIALGATVQDNLNLYGLAQEFGIFRLANGISDPLVKAGMSRTWTSLTTDIASGSSPASSYGLLWNSGLSRWETVRTFFGPVFNRYDSTTGAQTSTISLGTPEFEPRGGVALVGTNYYVLGYDTLLAQWWVKKYNGSLVHQPAGDWQYVADPSGGTPTIFSDGTNLIIARCPGAGANVGKPVVRTYNTTGTLSATVICDTAQPAGSTDLTGLYVGSADFGAARIVVSAQGIAARAFDSAGVRAATHDFNRAGFTNVNGLAWDGTRFHHLDDAGHVWHYAVGHVSAGTIWGGYTWYDADTSSGSSVHETKVSPAASFSWPARSFLVVDAQPAPEVGVTDPTKRDKANLVQIYAGPLSTTERLQASPALGITTAVLENLSTGAALAPTSSTFSSAGVTPGLFRSDKADGSSVPYTWFDGAGDGRAMRMLQSGNVLTGTLVATVETDLTITFAVAFAATPTVTCDPVGSATSLLHSYVKSTSTTGCVITVKRDTGTAQFTVGWQAMAATQ
jgi:hypothetical protein